MDLAVAALRARDTRWGYNCKRGNCNDLSIDVVTYFYGAGDGRYSPDVYLIDIIRGIKSEMGSPEIGDIEHEHFDRATFFSSPRSSTDIGLCDGPLH